MVTEHPVNTHLQQGADCPLVLCVPAKCEPGKPVKQRDLPGTPLAVMQIHGIYSSLAKLGCMTLCTKTHGSETRGMY